MIPADTLQNVLRTSIPQLAGAIVTIPDPLDAPSKAVIHGAINIFGNQHGFESEVDLNDFNSREDVVKLVEGFAIAFQKAEKQLGPLGAGMLQ